MTDTDDIGVTDIGETCARTRPILASTWQLNQLKFNLVTISDYALSETLKKLKLDNPERLIALFGDVSEKMCELDNAVPNELKQISNDYLAEKEYALYLMKDTKDKVFVLLKDKDDFYNLNAWPVASWQQPSNAPKEEVIDVNSSHNLLVAYRSTVAAPLGSADTILANEPTQACNSISPPL